MAAPHRSGPRPYRIEAHKAAPPEETGEGDRHTEIMNAFAALRELIKPSQEVSQAIVDQHRRDLQEAMQLKVELDAIAESIQRTKQEIATLHYAGAQGREMGRVTDELGAVVLGTETATNAILAAAERIDELSANLTSRLSGTDREIAREIGDHVLQIFEACNFQDITGQRIGKVVGAMRFVEARVSQMIEIWGGLETFKDLTPVEDPDRTGDRALLNGPPLETDDGCTSQSDIDALFG